MAMQASEIEQMIKAALPDATVEIRDLASGEVVATGAAPAALTSC